ncbi:hypothetical protein [Bacillus badius]|uniref:Uncharacterized protein n=1 Tax=Bacillus badius TaxID=1455 RepID=A0ABR5AQQ2_BACBA|nr:hypothetical protein [Bacillus badius]KIL77083.1 hypothetical protein SD77_1835 [Bacillus badius]MED0668065.1 hypothetical protein [Bacillus badius]MED4717844.1 hypothetical protein [Bacillus badius]UAT32952.1 hypothetical protein K7T73_20125 [Bacillus badius]
MTKQEVDALKPIVVPTYSETNKKKESAFLDRFKKMNWKGKAKTTSEKVEKKKKAEKVLRQTPSVLPFLKIDESCITLKNGVMDIFQINTKDLYSMSHEDLQYMLLLRTRFLRSYSADIKEVGLNFPSNTGEQKSYWMKKREKTTDPIRLRFIERKLFELDFLEKERTNREFFLFIYADTPQQLEERKKQAIRSMQHSFPLEKLSLDKKIDILFMLNNQNTKI